MTILISIKSFKINDFIAVHLLFNGIFIYVNNKRFRQCKYLVLNIPVDKINYFDEIESIDEAADILDRSLEFIPIYEFNIPPDAEFWGHCSNLQVWAENNYDTRLLHSNLSFPLLEELTKAGDKLAKKVFKEEIAKRLLDKPFAGKSLILNYLDILSIDEIESMIEEYLNELTFKKRIIDYEDLGIFGLIDRRYLKSKYRTRFLYVVFKFYDDPECWEELLFHYKVFPEKRIRGWVKEYYITNYKKGLNLLYALLNNWFRIGQIFHSLGNYRHDKRYKQLALKAYKKALKYKVKSGIISDHILTLRKDLSNSKKLGKKLRRLRMKRKLKLIFNIKSIRKRET